ncbi:MAG: ECF transporter S component [Oscillospiraceae bacterium]|nr:ECF transporter S component [Oscillospiraceae bacterium]
MHQSKDRKTLLILCMAAAMAALVALGSWIQIQIPSILGTSRFHLGNVMCALSGLLLGPWWGALAAGMGSALYDLLLDPTRFAEFPITFLTKSVYGLAAGAVFFKVLKGKSNYVNEAIASAAAAVSYIAVYLVKCFFYNGLLIKGLTPGGAWLGVLEKVPSSLFNGVVAVIFAPILGVALHKALKAAHLETADG